VSSAADRSGKRSLSPLGGMQSSPPSDGKRSLSPLGGMRSLSPLGGMRSLSPLGGRMGKGTKIDFESLTRLWATWFDYILTFLVGLRAEIGI